MNKVRVGADSESAWPVNVDLESFAEALPCFCEPEWKIVETARELFLGTYFEAKDKARYGAETGRLSTLCRAKAWEQAALRLACLTFPRAGVTFEFPSQPDAMRPREPTHATVFWLINARVGFVEFKAAAETPCLAILAALAKAVIAEQRRQAPAVANDAGETPEPSDV